jgi:hypothetical protein
VTRPARPAGTTKEQLMRRDSRLKTITEALQTGPGNNRRAHRIWGRASSATMDQGADGNVWAADIHDLARHVYTRLYGRPDTASELSPIAQAEKAKQTRDLVGEVAVLNSAHGQLTHAPWYPARPGDLVHVHYEQAGDFPAFGETYIVGDAGESGDTPPGLLSMRLLAHTLPETVAGLDAETTAAMTGVYAAEAHEDPLYDLWVEAGQHRLTIVRDGSPVHIGGAR